MHPRGGQHYLHPRLLRSGESLCVGDDYADVSEIVRYVNLGRTLRYESLEALFPEGEIEVQEQPS